MYCAFSLSSRLRSQEGTAIQMGGVLPHRLEAYCSTCWTICASWGLPNIAHKWRCTKYRHIQKREGDWQGRLPKCSLLRKTLQNKRLGPPLRWPDSSESISQIRANQAIRANRLRVPETTLFCEPRSGAQKNCSESQV